MRLLFPFALFGLAVAARAETTLQVHGSTTVRGALEPKQAQIETLIGRKVEFSGTGSTMGLASLAAGRAEIAMLANPLAETVGMLNAKMPGSVDGREFQASEVGHVRIAFIVNPRNRVRALSAAQLADLLTGKIKNWQQVGGSNAPVVVVGLSNAGSVLKTSLLGGAEVTSAARLVPNAAQIPGVVAQDANAIGIISTAHVKGPTSLIKTDAEVLIPLLLVTKGPPKPYEKAFIEAARQLLKE
ncbi:MAG TPA: substrate-binding domain-containing protein [Opitutaceae bacterium]|nr:substrate-binding domain-containing protein [Opitutaceae bacterium]